MAWGCRSVEVLETHDGSECTELNVLKATRPTYSIAGGANGSVQNIRFDEGAFAHLQKRVDA